MNLKLFIILGLGLMVSGCATSISRFQTAKTLDRGEFTIGAARGAGYSASRDEEREDNFRVEFSAPTEIWARAGISNKLDLGAKLSLPSSYTVDGKKGFYSQEDGACISLAGTVGFTRGSYEYKSISDIEKKVVNSDVFFSLIFSKNLFNKLFTIYGIPTFNLRTTIVEKTKINQSDTYGYEMIGGTGGISLNILKNLHIMYEYNYLQDMSESDIHHEQAGAGIAIDF